MTNEPPPIFPNPVDEAASDGQAHDSLEPGASTARLLVVDDDERLLQSTARLLESKGYPCLTATGGEQCLQILAVERIDLLLLDLSMPGVDGFAVLDRLPEEADLETIILSGHATFDNANRVFRRGVCDFLPKPHSPQQLLNAIDRALHKLELRRQLRYTTNQLDQSEQRYQFIASNSPDFIYLLDARERFTYVNEKSLELLGFEPSELEGQHFSVLLGEGLDPGECYAFKERRTGERASRDVELTLRRKRSRDDGVIPDSEAIIVELNAMGIYKSGESAPAFAGTYGVARDISKRKKAEEAVTFLAYHDLLTHLPNRALFLDRLKQAIAQAERSRSKLAVLYLDLDGFKYINDTMGHIVGDNLLQHVATRLRNLLRDSDTVSRVGGDEFNVLVANIHSETEAGLVAQKILDAFEAPIAVDRHEITVNFSIGISVYPDDASNSTDLIKNSDMAMYHSKSRGKRDFEFFYKNMEDIYRQRVQLEDEIRLALDEGQFECYFQPQYRVPGQKLFGLEALIRWNHPQRGLLSPVHFIPMAEEFGLIGAIGEYMLHRGCGQLRHWVDAGLDPLKLSINVSAAQLLDHDFDRTVHDIVAQYALPRNSVALEITETVLMQEMDAVIECLGRISARDIPIIIDDFGVGYSSLAYLQRLPVDILKIDRTFLDYTVSPQDRPCLLKGIVALARELDLTVIMEGVEDCFQLDYVQEAGCDVVQGYYLGRPMPASAVEQRLRPVF